MAAALAVSAPLSAPLVAATLLATGAVALTAEVVHATGTCATDKGGCVSAVAMAGITAAGGRLLRPLQALRALKPIRTANSSAPRMFRAVEHDELADLLRSGQYRTAPGLRGKYFFPTQQQASDFAELMAKIGRGPFCVTSGCIESGLLRQADRLLIAGEGPAWFVPEKLLPYIDDIMIHGSAG